MLGLSEGKWEDVGKDVGEGGRFRSGDRKMEWERLGEVGLAFNIAELARRVICVM